MAAPGYPQGLGGLTLKRRLRQFPGLLPNRSRASADSFPKVAALRLNSRIPTGQSGFQKGEGEMKHVARLVWKLRIWKDTRGQDLIEYALMAGFVAVAAGAVMPNVAQQITTIFNKIKDQLTNAASQG
jgi:pilus assembly protein Flp/PilA